MRRFLCAALLAAPAALLAQPAQAQYYGTTNGFGASTYSTYNTPSGTYRVHTQRIGNSVYSNGYGDDGTSSRCVTTQIGNSLHTNCY